MFGQLVWQPLWSQGQLSGERVPDFLAIKSQTCCRRLPTDEVPPDLELNDVSNALRGIY
jgi:hypothetical protein